MNTKPHLTGVPATIARAVERVELGAAAMENHDRSVWQSLRSKGRAAEPPYTFAQAWAEAHRIQAAELDRRIDARNKEIRR